MYLYFFLLLTCSNLFCIFYPCILIDLYSFTKVYVKAKVKIQSWGEYIGIKLDKGIKFLIYKSLTNSELQFTHMRQYAFYSMCFTYRMIVLSRLKSSFSFTFHYSAKNFSQHFILKIRAMNVSMVLYLITALFYFALI